jgi:putative Holliday junction resolvase
VSGHAGERGRVLALDPGAARIGIAVSDSARSMAFPRPPVTAGAGEIERVAMVVREEGAGTVVVGHPLRLDGSVGPGASRAVELADALRGALATDDIEVVLHDERLTTVTATTRLRDAGVDARRARGRVDGAAAVVLLEAWLAA